MFPRVLIDLKKFRHNLKNMLEMSHNHGMTVMGVSKVFCADHELVNIMIEEGVDFIADSRIENLEKIKTDIPKVLLRLPMISEAKKVVEFSDISLNSEYATIKELHKEAKHLDKVHEIILMIDLGDLREGIIDEEDVYHTVHHILELSHIKLKGIGTNLTCYGGVIPSVSVLNKLVEFKTTIEEKFNIELDIISGGNSSNIELMLEGGIPEGINNIRLGESIVLGRETAYGNWIDNMYNDVFTLEAEIIELKEKPSVPIGEIGMNAFGKVPVFKDKGTMLRAIIGIGKQDVDHTEIIPYDTIECIGSSSDHIIVDVSESYNIYQVGDPILFRLTYASVLSLMTSPYVKKVYVR
jgi:predicted amino acid racemase